ncbi:hypothetical protein Hanom_Chr03g00224971 [Helianthus anomalus]
MADTLAPNFFSYYTQISNSIAPLLDSHRVLVPRALSAIIYHEYSHTPKCTEPNTPTREPVKLIYITISDRLSSLDFLKRCSNCYVLLIARPLFFSR